MGKLLRFEWLKNRKNSKNIVMLVLFTVILIGFLLVSGILSKKYIVDERVNYTSDKWYSVMKMNELLSLCEEKDMGEEMKTELEFWRQVYQYAVSQDVYKHWRGEDRWRDVVRETIEKNEYLLDGKEQGISSYNRVTDQELQNEIAKDTMFLEEDIKPLDSEYQMTSFHFLYQVLHRLFPYLLVVVVLVVCSDCMSSELDTGSYKFLMLQPYKRTRIFVCKTVASITYTLGSVLLILGIIFFGNGVINGFGNPNYPVAIDGTSFGVFQSESFTTGAVTYTGIGKYLLYALPLAFLYLLFTAVFAIFISTLAQTSIGALSTSVGITLASILLLPYVANNKKLSMVFPVSYSDPVNVLSGETYGTALAGMLVLSVASLCLYVLNIGLFKRRDLV